MTQTTPERHRCSVCPGEYTLTANKTIRHHLTDNPDFQAGPDSRKCRGAGELPAGAAPAGDQSADGPQCRLCKHPAVLTGNGRVRSHFTPEATPRPCPAGSDFPLGTYPDIVGTTDGLVATLAFDCEHRDAGACYDCWAARGVENCPDHGDPIECTCQAKAGQAQMMAEKQQTMAEQLKAAGDAPQCPHPEYGVDQYGAEACIVCGTVKQTDSAQASVADDGRPEASRFTELLERETRGTGTVMDRLKTDPMHAAAVAALEQPAPELNHRYTDPSGIVWVHSGPEETCEAPDCVTLRGGAGDEWRTPGDLLAKMPEEIRGMDALRFNCADCKHPITPLVDQFAFDGRAAVVVWACELRVKSMGPGEPCRDHQCRPDCLVNVGELEHGDHFVRRGTLMRATSSGYGTVEAVVLEGPHKGRKGELKNAAEQVERTYCRHEYVDDEDAENGSITTVCKHCEQIKEQETKECAIDSMQSKSPRSSAAPTRPATTDPGPARGSKPPSGASAQAVSPKSSPVTSSGPTAKASTSGRSAAVTTDQSAAAAAFLGGGRTTTPAASGPENQTDAAAQFLAGGSGAHGEKETKRDRFGRYLIPHPDTGKETAWTRSTTFAKSISDTYALSQWGLRMALLGATMRPDIVKRAHGKHVRADKKLLDELTADLKDAAGDKVAANLGTSMHSFTELADRAWHSPGGPRSVMGQIPEDCRPMVETYIRLLEETGLEPVPHLIEFTTVVKQYGVAGTSDNCYKVTRPLTLNIGRAEVKLSPGEYVIGDKKTGKDLDYGWQEIAIQLGTYAQGINTAGVWDRHEETWHPDPLNGAKVRLDAGIVIHLPVDPESEKSPAVYGIDLESGWNAAVLCERVRTWRKARNLAGPVMVSEAQTFAPSRPAASAPDTGVTTRTNVRPASLKDRAANVTSNSEASAVWKQAKKEGLPDAEVDALVKTMQARLAEREEKAG